MDTQTIYNIATGESVTAPYERPVVDPAEVLAAERASMVCSPLQGRLALGEAEWSRVEAMLADPETPWAMRQVIASASVWQRLSPMIDELAWLMGYDDEQVDGLFRAAMQIVV